MHRFQTIAHIRQSTADDDGHGIIEVAFLHLLFDGDGGNALRINGWQSTRIFCVVGQPETFLSCLAKAAGKRLANAT